MSKLAWLPKGALPGVCQKAKRAWEQWVERHESWHVRKADSLTKQPSAKKRFYACADSEAEAKRLLEEQMNRYGVEQVESLGKASDEAAIAFHKTPEGRPIEIDCSGCKAPYFFIVVATVFFIAARVPGAESSLGRPTGRCA